MPNRRQWLTQWGALSGAMLLNWPSTHSAFATESSAELIVNPDQSLIRVRMEMTLEGNVHIPSNPLVSRKSEGRLPIKSDAVFDYEERLRLPVGADPKSEVTTAERYYHEATSTSRLSRNAQAFKLRDIARQTIVRRDELPEVIYGVNDYLTQQEVELLRVPTTSVTIDQLLPKGKVEVGYIYEPERTSLVSLLNLASIEESDVRCEVAEITAQDVKLQMHGKVSGFTEGVPTTIRIVGKLTFDRRIGSTTWMALAIHETREIGKSEPGFDIAATIRMVRQPLVRTIKLPAQPIEIAMTEPIPRDRLFVEVSSSELGFVALMDRRWRTMSDVPGSSMMRMIENDRSIAQCDVRPLARLKPGEQWTLEAFQADVRRTLGNQLSELFHGEERVSDTGLRVLQITAGGSVQGVAVQWILQHFSDDAGRRVLATFTMAGESADTFAGSNVQFADSMRFTEHSETAAPEPLSSTGPNNQPTSLSRAANKPEPVSSASDLR